MVFANLSKMPALTKVDIEEFKRALTLSHLALSRSETSSFAPASFTESRLSEAVGESVFELICERVLIEVDALMKGVCLRKVRRMVNIQVVDKGRSGDVGSVQQ